MIKSIQMNKDLLKKSNFHNDNIGLWQILIFYVPLLINSGMLTLSSNIMNYGVGTSLTPELALASFAAGHSIMLVVNSITLSIRHVYSTHLVDKKSFIIILKFYLCLAFIASTLYLFLGLTDFGIWIFVGLLKIPKDISNLAQTYFIYIFPLPFFKRFKNCSSIPINCL